MSARPEVLFAILAIGMACYACRAAGYLTMGFVHRTPRVEAWLQAIPMAVYGAVLGPIALRGGPPEWAGIALAAVLMRRTGNDFVAVLGGLGAVIGLRWLL